MPKTVSLSMLALAAFMAGMASYQSPAEARHRGRNIAIGIGAAAATAIILSEAARASERRSYRRARISCAELADRCDEGSDWACRKYYNRCE